MLAGLAVPVQLLINRRHSPRIDRTTVALPLLECWKILARKKTALCRRKEYRISTRCIRVAGAKLVRPGVGIWMTICGCHAPQRREEGPTFACVAIRYQLCLLPMRMLTARGVNVKKPRCFSLHLCRVCSAVFTGRTHFPAAGIFCRLKIAFSWASIPSKNFG